MKTLILATFFYVKFADYEDGRWNYLLRAMVPVHYDNGDFAMREHYVSYHSKEKYSENTKVYLEMKVECHGAYGFAEESGQYYHSAICNYIEDKDDSNRPARLHQIEQTLPDKRPIKR